MKEDDFRGFDDDDDDGEYEDLEEIWTTTNNSS